MPESELPGDIRATIGRRVELLAEDTRRMLAAASVLGRRFDVRTLAATTHTDRSVVAAALVDAVAAEVVIDDGDGRYVFSHALVEDTLYDGLTWTRRARLHRAAAEAMEQLEPENPPLAAIADHYCRALPTGDPQRAVDYARRAGEEAADRGACEQAVQHYEQARDGRGDRCRQPSRRPATDAPPLRAGRGVRRGRAARARAGSPGDRDRARRGRRRRGRSRAVRRSD